ncbi:MAG: hypothetical protein GC178_18360 [Flavobacteriales bacterium]|nr:hypothetical protein [Flavobacteriales bacterium]
MTEEKQNTSAIQRFSMAAVKHLVAVAVMLLTCFILVPSAFQGKMIMQGDKLHSLGMKRDVKAHYEQTGELTNWTDRSYCGMPTTLIYPVYPNNRASGFVNSLEKWTQPQIVHLMFPMLCLYIALVVSGYPVWLALLGALVFGLSTINVGNMTAGHSSKVKAIATALPILIGLYLLFDRRFLRGFFLMVLFGALHLATNHLQITYYALLGGFVLGMVRGIQLLREKDGIVIPKAVGLALLAVIIGVLPNISMLWSNYAYTKDSVRGKRILTAESQGQSNGLDREYAYIFSHDLMEMGSLILPHIVGGSAHELVGKDSESYKYIQRTGLQGSRISGDEAVVPLFWGEKPVNESPTYIGIVAFCLFLLGMVFGSKKLRITIGAMLMLYFIIALGDNTGFINQLMFDHVPFFNRFRAPSMVLGLAVGLMAWVSVDGLHRLLKDPEQLKQKRKVLIGGGAALSLFFLFFLLIGPSYFDFSWDYGAETHGVGIDENFRNQLIHLGNPEKVVDGLLEALRSDRASAMRSDAFRGSVLLIIVVIAMLSWIKGWLRGTRAVLLLGVMTTVDLLLVDRPYSTSATFAKSEDFIRASPPSDADVTISRIALASDRVIDLTAAVMQDARPSYYFNNIGGNHAAKLRRFQDLTDHYLDREIQMVKSGSRQAEVPILNMLNARFFKVGYGMNDFRENITANGFAWFVDSLAWVNGPDEEMELLSKLDRAKFVTVDERFKSQLASVDTAASAFSKVELSARSPGKVAYLVSTDRTKLLVMSEIWYQGNNYWHSFIDDEPVEHVRVNYLLRGIVVPPGLHKVRFEYEAKPFKEGEPLAAAGSGTWLLAIFGCSILFARKKEHLPETTES